jgi:ribosome-binding ATPase YchF (GTP1/OBG family)
MDSASRSALFKALTPNAHLLNASTLRLPVPDETLDALAVKAGTKRKVPASIEAKLVNDLKGERSTGKSWVMVVDSFESYRKLRDEISDLDVELLTSRLSRVSSDVRLYLEAMLKSIERKEPLVIPAESEILKHTTDVISSRPWIVVENFDKSLVESDLGKFFKTSEISCVQYHAVNIDLENELNEIAEDTFRSEYAQSFGFPSSALPTLVRRLPALLGQGVFYTVGEIEARAWLYTRGVKISEASAAIHSDFPKKFLQAEVVKVGEYLKFGLKARTNLKSREYELEDGQDILDIKLKK